jgi:hypothetical protein
MTSDNEKGGRREAAAVQTTAEPGRSIPEQFHQPTAREAAMTVLLLLQTRKDETGKPVTRARLTEITLRRLWARTRISSEFVLDVQEYLLQAGWALFWAGSSYATIQVSSVEGWARISYNRIPDQLARIKRGRFDFSELEPLLLSTVRKLEQDVDE